MLSMLTNCQQCSNRHLKVLGPVVSGTGREFVLRRAFKILCLSTMTAVVPMTIPAQAESPESACPAGAACFFEGQNFEGQQQNVTTHGACTTLAGDAGALSVINADEYLVTLYELPDCAGESMPLGPDHRIEATGSPIRSTALTNTPNSQS